MLGKKKRGLTVFDEGASQQLLEGYTLRPFSEVQPVDVSWLWHPYIPLGKITILQGDPGCGKTTLVLLLAAMLSRGESFPENRLLQNPVTVIFQTAEDGLDDTIKPRLMQYGADCSKIQFLEYAEKELTLDDERVEKAILKAEAKLFVFDPIQAFLGQRVDMHRANEVRPILRRLGAIASRTGCAIILVGHMTKGKTKSLYRSLGSVDIVAAARSVLLFAKHPEDATMRCMAPVKSSLAAEGKTIAFTLKENGLQFHSFCNISTECLLEGSSSEEGALDEAKRFLLKQCREGIVKSQSLWEMAQANNISHSTYKRAKKQLGISSKKIGDQWFSCLPNEINILENQGDQEVQTQS